jgi:hypothetical protein
VPHEHQVDETLLEVVVFYLYLWARKATEYKPSDIQTPDAQREDGKMTFEDSYMIGTDLMVCHDVDDDDDDEYYIKI